MENDNVGKDKLKTDITAEKEKKENAEKLRRKIETENFKRRYFEMYDDVKISYKEDW